MNLDLTFARDGLVPFDAYAYTVSGLPEACDTFNSAILPSLITKDKDNRYPMFRDATVNGLALEPGEVFFMPVGWWHYVRALDVSITVSFTKRRPNNTALSMSARSI